MNSWRLQSEAKLSAKTSQSKVLFSNSTGYLTELQESCSNSWSKIQCVLCWFHTNKLLAFYWAAERTANAKFELFGKKQMMLLFRNIATLAYIQNGAWLNRKIITSEFSRKTGQQRRYPWIQKKCRKKCKRFRKYPINLLFIKKLNFTIKFLKTFFNILARNCGKNGKIPETYDFHIWRIWFVFHTYTK